MIGAKDEDVSFHEIPAEERAHYSKRSVDTEFRFPFGLKELYGIAYRTDFDLQAHAKMSGKNLLYRDPMTNETFIPHCIEPTWGLNRTMLVVLLSAFEEVDPRSGDSESVHEKEVVLHLPKALAPIKVAILPLSKKEPLSSTAKKILADLSKYWMCQYDETGSIGKRYRRQDEIGTPYCVTVDFETVEKDQAVTIRDRDTTKQERVKISDLLGEFQKRF